MGLGVRGSLFSDAFRHPAAESFADGNWPMTAGFLRGGKEVTAEKVRGDGVGDFPSCEGVYHARHCWEKDVAAIGRRTFAEMRGSGGGWSGGGEGVEG